VTKKNLNKKNIKKNYTGAGILESLSLGLFLVVGSLATILAVLFSIGFLSLR
jgi:hypothetical protein